ncbi:hypothetical protein FACS1894102_7520 [Spirochaetia bacterium]|nr:hypothetical protein FACS1894102_7520 [Spirochaetia bacterium]
MSAIIDFYKGQAPDAKGRMLCDIHKWNYSKLEDVHTYIQWLFPLKTHCQSCNG